MLKEKLSDLTELHVESGTKLYSYYQVLLCSLEYWKKNKNSYVTC